MATKVVCPKHRKDGEVDGAKKERQGQVAHRTVGRKAKEGSSNSGSVDGVGRSIESS